MNRLQEQREKTEKRRKQKRTITAKLGMGNESGALTITDQVIVTSDEQAEARQFIETLARCFHRTVEFHKYTGVEPAEAQSMVDKDRQDEQYREYARSQPVREVSFYNLAILADGDINEALKVWGDIRAAALDEWESGGRSAEVAGANTPMDLARFLVIRDRFTDGWIPQNSIETAMIEMLAEQFSLFQYWTAIAHGRALGSHDAQVKDLRRFETAGWKSPYQSQADAIEQAHRFADGYNRQFLRTLRQLRDFRRYSLPPPPVIVNQLGGQVNVANQQVNVTHTD